MDDEKDKTYEPGMDLDEEEEGSDHEYDDEDEVDTDELIEDDDDDDNQSVEEVSGGEEEEDDDDEVVAEQNEEQGKQKDMKEMHEVEVTKDKNIAQTSNKQTPKRFSFRIRKDKSSVEGGVFKVPFSKNEDVNSKKGKPILTNEQKRSLSTPSKFSPSTLKSIASDVQKNEIEKVVTTKKFTKVIRFIYFFLYQTIYFV